MDVLSNLLSNGKGSCSTQNTNGITSKVAYLAGVKEEFFTGDNLFDIAIFKKMENDKDCRIIRNLSIVRTVLLRNYNQVNNAIVHQLKNLASIPEYLDPNIIKTLEEDGIDAIHTNWSPRKYIPRYSELIKARISNCRKWFPIWIEWDFIKELFIVNIKDEKSINEVRRKFTQSINDYPFRMFFNMKGNNGTILNSDYKFVTTLYEMHGRSFADSGKLKDISESKKDGLYHFIDGGENVAIIVDCENANVFKLYSVLEKLGAEQREKISKILLYDDEHTASTWKILKKFVGIKVEHVMVDRIISDKSQVDMRLAVGACKQHYEEAIDSFILFSSDSDYWGLIDSMDTCRFLVMLEREKTSIKIVDALTDNLVPFCYIDDFCSANLEPIQSTALNIEIQAVLKGLSFNLDAIIETAMGNTKVQFSGEEVERFKQRYLSKMHLATEEGRTYVEL